MSALHDTMQAPLLENSHQFAEYTYKNITSCDVCSQIMKGSARQGLKCKLCRMNVHADCQDRVGVVSSAELSLLTAADCRW